MEIKTLKIKDNRAGRNNMTVLSRECFDHYFIAENYGRADFFSKLGITDKIFQNTYRTYYTKEERRKFANERIAKAQKDNNSNSINTGKLKLVLEEKQLIEYLEAGEKVDGIAKKLGCSPQSVYANIDYYGISLEGFNYCSYLGATEITMLKQLDTFFGTKLLEYHTLGVKREVDNILETCLNMDFSLKEMAALVRKVAKNTTAYARVNNIEHQHYKLPGSIVNHIFGKAFTSEGYRVLYEYGVEDKLYDLHILGTNILVEVDTLHYHTSHEAINNDLLKNDVARRNKYHLVRIRHDKETEVKIIEKVKVCLHNLKSARLLPLESKRLSIYQLKRMNLI